MDSRKSSLVLRAVVAAGLVAMVVLQAGCLLVAAGAVAGASTVVYVRGELEASLRHGFESVDRATNRAIDQLQFKKMSETRDSLTAVIKAHTADDTTVEIKIVRVTDVLTKVVIRAGVLGDQALSATILEKIKSSL